MTRILLVEDDPSIIRTLSEYLSEVEWDPSAALGMTESVMSSEGEARVETSHPFSHKGFQVSAATGKMQAERLLEKERFDLCLLDVTLSNGSGFDLCPRLVERGIPVIFLTASGDENSVVRGLELGAEDYISKPFRPRELLSRIRRILRRNGADANQEIRLPGGISVSPERAAVTKNGEQIPMSALEYRLFTVFLQNRGRLLSREQLLSDIWDVGGDYVNDNTLTVYIKRLREKIEDDPQDPKIILTVRGMGYRMD